MRLSSHIGSIKTSCMPCRRYFDERVRLVDATLIYSLRSHKLAGIDKELCVTHLPWAKSPDHNPPSPRDLLVPLGSTASDSDHTSSTEGSEKSATMCMRQVGSDSHPITASALRRRQPGNAARSISARLISANRESVSSSPFISGGSPQSSIVLHRAEGASPFCS